MEIWCRKTATSDRVSRIAGMFVIYDPQPISEVEPAIQTEIQSVSRGVA